MDKVDKVVILGGGAFGVALAKLFSQKCNSVTLWARSDRVCQYINDFRHHPSRLTQVTLPKEVTAKANLKQAVMNMPYVICALPMEALGPVLKEAHEQIAADAIVVSTAKGIVFDSLFLPCDVLDEVLPRHLSMGSCYLSGPSFAHELALDLPAALTIASLKKESAMNFQEQFSSPRFRLYTTNDVIGVCAGGAFKNVIAIAAGACSGLGLGKNAQAALITRGLAEIARLTVSMGGRFETVSGLSGMGDLVLSCTDDTSRNHRLGIFLAEGLDLKSALEKIGSVVEGVKTASFIPALVKKYCVDLPILSAVHSVLYNRENVKSAMLTLLSRKFRVE